LVQISDNNPAVYVIFCTPFLPRPSYGQLSTPEPHSRTPFACVPISVSQIRYTPISNNRHNYSSVYLDLYIFGYHTGRHKILRRLIAIILWLHSALNFFMNVILVCWVCSKDLKCSHFRTIYILPYFVILSFMLITRHDHILIFLIIYF